MPLDDQARAYLETLRALNAPPIEEQDLAEARAANESAAAALFGEPEPVAQARDRELPGPGGPVPVRVYLPDAAGPLPVLVYNHGGGWVVGSLETHDGVCRALANRAGCIVVAVDYRMAPEHRFPAAVEDAWAVVQWLADHAPRIGGDPGRLAVGGDSAGGNLAAVMALRARDAGVPLALQLLIYPVVDHDLDTASYLANADGYGLRREAMRWYWDQYAPDPARRADPEASPLRAASLAGVAPAMVVTCEHDPLCDEGEAYARRLAEAGVAVRLRRFDGMIHGFIRMPAVIGAAKVALDEAGAALREAFAASREPAPRP